MPIKNRIIGHETVKARDLVPYPLNFRKYPDEQRQAPPPPTTTSASLSAFSALVFHTLAVLRSRRDAALQDEFDKSVLNTG